MSQYLPIVVLLVLAVVFGAISFVMSRLLAPRRPSAAKEAPYECGIVPSREPPERFPVSFYVVAMLFIMFDIEIIFVYPYAVAHGELGTYGFVAIVIFSALFFLTFVYEVARGGLDWGPLQRVRDLAADAAQVSPQRTLATTIRRVGTDGRERARGSGLRPMGAIDDIRDDGLAGMTHNVITGKIEELVKWARSRSSWPANFGLACCAIEMMAAGGAHYDISRFGMEVFRASPRQADIMIVAGRVSQKMAPVLRQVYDQMMEPKWVISMGVCASTGGMFNNYAIVQGVDQIVPVDVYAPGCPPTPETLLHAIETLHQLIEDGELMKRRARRVGAPTSTSPRSRRPASRCRSCSGAGDPWPTPRTPSAPTRHLSRTRSRASGAVRLPAHREPRPGRRPPDARRRTSTPSRR